MGKKKRKAVTALPWCWYCEREFANEKVLIDHQKAKHYKCEKCGRKLASSSGMKIHLLQVHNEICHAVPNAIKGRDGFEIEIYGMLGNSFL
jgi:DNA-directed RNA polymerase subunit RPC12/RpoP